MEYGVLVNNKFALFDSEDEDPLEVLQRTQDAANQSKAVKENTNAKSRLATKNAKNASKSDSKQPTKVLTPTQEQKVKTSTQNVPPRRDNVAGECSLSCADINSGLISVNLRIAPIPLVASRHDTSRNDNHNVSCES